LGKSVCENARGGGKLRGEGKPNLGCFLHGGSSGRMTQKKGMGGGEAPECGRQWGREIAVRFLPPRLK